MLRFLKISSILTSILIWNLILTTGKALSNSEDNIQIIKKFGICMSEYSKITKGKVCGAYVPWGPNISNLTKCLLNPNITHSETDYDKIGNVYEIGFQLNCGNKKIWVTLGNKEHPDNFFVKSVGEIVN